MYAKKINESGLFKDSTGNGFNILIGESFETPNGLNVGFTKVESINEALEIFELNETENITEHIEVVEVWQYTDRPIKMCMTYKQAAKLAMIMPEFAAMAKQLNIPFVEKENGIVYYFEFMLSEHRKILENLSTIIEK